MRAPVSIRNGALVAILGFATVAAGSPARAEVRLPVIFSDHMVLQCDAPVRVWGTAAPGEDVRVAIGGQSHATRADQAGRWGVTLDPFATNSALTLRVIGRNTIELHDVVAGEVWLCSGQSNMGVPVGAAADAGREIAAANFPSLRFMTVAPRGSLAPSDEVIATAWQACSPTTVANCTAVGYYFGRELHRDLNVPVGLIHSSVGGSPIEGWIGREVLDTLPALRESTAAGLRRMRSQPEALKSRPRPNSATLQNTPTILYNAMIYPLIPYRIRGVIWYQGESNTARASVYGSLFARMIADWRGQWGEGAFPVEFVQLASYLEPPVDPGAPSGWAELREAQARILRNVPNTGMAVAIDIGEADNIHPANKQDVGRRLALIALANTYGRRLECSGPTYESMSVEDGRIRIHFAHAEGLVAHGGPLKRFAIAGSDRRFHWAQARIDGETVVVSSPDESRPVAVRYAWADNPEGCNLYNGAGLPAPPLRTDNWRLASRPVAP